MRLYAFQIHRAVALLETRREVLFGILFLRCRDGRLHTRQVHAHGLLAVHVLARACTAAASMRGCSKGGVAMTTASTSLASTFSKSVYTVGFSALMSLVALSTRSGNKSQRAVTRPGGRVDDARVVRPVSAASDQPDRNLGIGLGPAHRLRRDDRKGGGGGRASPPDQLPAGNGIRHNGPPEPIIQNYRNAVILKGRNLLCLMTSQRIEP